MMMCVNYEATDCKKKYCCKECDKDDCEERCESNPLHCMESYEKEGEKEND